MAMVSPGDVSPGGGVSFEDSDLEDSSITAAGRSSVRGAMSDWDSNLGVGPDSAVAEDAAAAVPRRSPRTRLAAEGMSVGDIGSARGPDTDHGNFEASTAACDGGEGGNPSGGGGSRGLSTLRIFRWWSDVVSRVSRSADRLLNQHSPNLNDILDGSGDVPLERPRRGVQSQGRSIPEDEPPRPPSLSLDDDDEREREVFALREEVALLKKKLREVEAERGKERLPVASNGPLIDERVQRPHTESQLGVRQSNTSSCKDDLAGIESDVCPSEISDIPSLAPVEALRPDQISRYSRQLLLSDGFGVEGQKKLLSSSVLVVGAGGIGSTVLLYLAAAGVGHVTICDHDDVETSNLHRQVIHRDVDARDGGGEERPRTNKTISAKRAMLALNPTMSCAALPVMIAAENASDLVARHDVVVDACDNPRTRYLLNDACVLAGKTLVSGSAMGTEGQLTVYNYNSPAGKDGPEKKRTACYRCLYPKPVASEGRKSCSDNGVLGTVPGAVGVLQAVEAIKVLTGLGTVLHDRLLMYDALRCSFLSVKKPPRRPKCAVCSPAATIRTMDDSEASLGAVRGPGECAFAAPADLPDEANVTCVEYDEVRRSGQAHVLLDVRVPRQYDMCSLEGSTNVPLDRLESDLGQIGELSGGKRPVYCLCRRGIASAEATRILRKGMGEGRAEGVHSVYNVSGGLESWTRTVDSGFPRY
ncbi:hypothetical protein ACHAWF_016017 [Thalassiosira exigua]